MDAFPVLNVHFVRVGLVNHERKLNLNKKVTFIT